MKLIVISPEAEDVREHAVLARLFAAGLASYHLRKPTWTRVQLAAWFRELPVELHCRVVLHSHHDLATEFTLGGLHQRDAVEPICHLLSDKSVSVEVVDEKQENTICNLLSDKYSAVARAGIRSRSVHDAEALRAAVEVYDRVLVSPIFPSFSKPGYGPSIQLSEAELRAVLALPRRTEVIALGGIDFSRIAACHELGFDGVAVLGAVWQADDPVQAFQELSRVAAEVTRLDCATPSSLVTSAAT